MTVSSIIRRIGAERISHGMADRFTTMAIRTDMEVRITDDPASRFRSASKT